MNTEIRYRFEPGDFDGSGQYLIYSKKAELTNAGSILCSLYKICYVMGETWHLVSMTDGLIWKPGFANKQELTEFLNSKRSENKYYRPITSDEMEIAFNYVKKHNRWTLNHPSKIKEHENS